MQRSMMWFAGVAAFFICATSAECAEPAQPRVFAPGAISSTAGVDCLTFSPDGKTIFFDQQAGWNGFIMEAHRVGGGWSTPRIAPFSGQWMDHDPAMAPAGSFLIYTSNRSPTPGGEPLKGGNLWRVNRVGDTWSAPVRLPDTVNFGTHIYAPSVAANGDVYFLSMDDPSHQPHIYHSAWRDGRYQKAARVKLMPDGMRELDPAIAPDGSFIVFDAGKSGSKQPDHLYIAFREHGRWSKPVDFGAVVDAYQPWGAHLGPDGRTLCFTSNYTAKVDYPRSPAQARADLARMRAWDNGTNHIYSLALTPWLQAHRADDAQASHRTMHDTKGATQ